MRRPVFLGLAAAALAAAQASSPASHTERMDFPANGTLRLADSRGELTITGWDRPDLEVTILKTSGRAAVTTERKGNEVVITTTGPRLDNVEYRIRAPRSASVVVGHKAGEVHLDGMLGEIRVTDRQGLITVRLPEQAQLQVDARSRLGSIETDFGGQQRKKLKFGHALLDPGSPGGQKLYLRIGFGDIFIL